MSGNSYRAPTYRKPHRLKTSGGYALTSCECCGAEPVREVEGQERRSAFNWLATCRECKLRCCLVCLPDTKRICVGCLHARETPALTVEASAMLTDGDVSTMSSTGDTEMRHGTE